MHRLALDFSQHRRLVSVDGTIRKGHELPAVLLPIRIRDQGMAGSAAEGHVRGLGLPWPPEAQVPVADDPHRGLGRIPLATCWSRIQSSRRRSKSAATETEQSPLDSPIIDDFRWVPTPDQEISLSPGQALGLAVDACRREFGPTQGPTVLVSPSSLDEGMQQYVLDACGTNTYILPRSIAITLAWLSGHADQATLLPSSAATAVEMGHVVVISCGFDDWEMDIVPIEVRDLPDGRVLLPVRLTPSPRMSLGAQGLPIALGRHLTATSPAAHEAWRTLVSDSSSTTWDITETVDEFLIRSHNAAERSPLSKWMDLCDHPQDPIATRVRRLYEQRKAETGTTSQLIAILANGEIAESKCAGAVLAARMVSELERSAKRVLMRADSTIRGADAFLRRHNHNKTAYLEELIPVSIHYQTRIKGHIENAWKSLIDQDKPLRLPAGKEFVRDPILDFSVEAGKKQLDLTLRRPLTSVDSGFLHRGITIEFPVAADKREPVVITTKIRPGQGYAQVLVSGLYNREISALLNWRDLAKVEEPRLKTIGYPPVTARITPDPAKWDAARPVIKQLKDNPIRGNISKLREIANEWESFISRHGADAVSDEDIFAHYGLFPVNDNSRNETIEREANQIVLSLGDAWRSHQNQAIRLCAWMYDLAPEQVVEWARRRIADDNIEITDLELHVATLTFRNPKEISVFWTRLHKELISNPTGHLYSMAFDWLRPIRNLCMFRDASLSQSTLNVTMAEDIFSFVCQCLIDIIGKDKRHMFSLKAAPDRAKIRNQAIRTLPFLLRRRMFDDSFARAGSRIDQLMRTAISSSLKDDLGTQAAAMEKYLFLTEKFLDSKATMDDIRSLVI